MISRLKKSLLFTHMSDDDIENCISCSRSEIVSCPKGKIIFLQQGKPEKLFILIEGSVSICHDTITGKRNLVTTINQPSDLFGEVYLFLKKQSYDHYAMAAEDSIVLQMPKGFLYHTCSNNCSYHTLLISNMLSILAGKALLTVLYRQRQAIRIDFIQPELSDIQAVSIFLGRLEKKRILR